MFEYADDTNLLVPDYNITDVSSTVEFPHIKAGWLQWSDNNNLGKTKELVLHRPQSSSYNKHDLNQSLEGTERVQTAKRTGVILQISFSFLNHVDVIFKVCSQRIFLLKQLRDQRMPLMQLHRPTTFQAIIHNRLSCYSALGTFLTAELNAF